MYEYNVTTLRILDGDTIEFDVDLGFSVHTHTIVRLDRVNAWELTDPRGWPARGFVNDLLHKAAQVRIVSRKQEKYGRWLAEVNLLMKSTDRDWLNLNDELVKTGHAVYVNYG